MRTALTIAGSDSSGAAGIQADLKTFAAWNVYGVSVITAVTAQSTGAVAATFDLPADLVTAQLETLAGDFRIDATKTGMLGNAAIVEAVAAAIEELELASLVVDPVLVSTSGTPLIDEDGIAALRSELIPLARVVTPNLPEAEALSGMRVDDAAGRRAAARHIHNMGAAVVVIKGGHDDGAEILDLIYDGRTFTELRIARAEGDVRGTGCAFASALTANLAHGSSLEDAVRAAQAFVAGAVRHRISPGRGRPVLNHFWRTRAD